MKRFTLIAISVVAAHASYGQKTEYSAHLNSGLFAYRGAATARNTSISVSDVSNNKVYIGNPYGSRPALSYGAAGQVQRITRHGHVVGLQGGYEVLRSRVNITRVVSFSMEPETVMGRTNMVSHFANAHPYVGHRFALQALHLDLTAGPEIGYFLDTYHRGEATISGSTIKINEEWYSPQADVRARVNLTAYYQQFGLSLGYSYGLTSYHKRYFNGYDDAIQSQMLRVGAVYRFN